MIDGFWKQTRREKRAHSAALNLFFGALLGANLGTLTGLPLRDYVYLIVLLVGTVSTLHISIASERRGYIALLILFYLALFAAHFLKPSLRPAMAEDDLLKLVATLAIWFGAVVMVEFTPTLDPPASAPPPEQPPA